MAQTQIQLSFPEMDDRNWDEVEPPPATSTDAPPDKFSPKVANEI